MSSMATTMTGSTVNAVFVSVVYPPAIGATTRQSGCIQGPMRRSTRARERARGPIALVTLVLFVPGCTVNPRPFSSPIVPVREISSSVMLHGTPLELHLSTPQGPAADDVLVLYASGDGGWFGTAVDMFHRVGRAGYYTVGFSAKAFLKLERPKGAPVNPEQLAEEYGQILARSREAMQLSPNTPAILTGWSRGAAFAVLAGSEPGAPANLRGVIAIGLSDGEDLEVNGPADETDDDTSSQGLRRWPFEPYRRIARLAGIPCAVIQASGDSYLAASRARVLFGPDTPARRFYSIDARNHRFSGGKDAFDRALLDAIHWMTSLHGSSELPDTQASAWK